MISARIVDEPFAYLDLDRARELWRLLCGAARERQVEGEIRAAALTLRGNRAAVAARVLDVKQAESKVADLENQKAAGVNVTADLAVARLDLPGRIKSLHVSNAAALAPYVASRRLDLLTPPAGRVTHPTPDARQRAHELYDRGREAFNAGRHAEAAELFDERCAAAQERTRRLEHVQAGRGTKSKRLFRDSFRFSGLLYGKGSDLDGLEGPGPGSRRSLELESERRAVTAERERFEVALNRRGRRELVEEIEQRDQAVAEAESAVARAQAGQHDPGVPVSPGCAVQRGEPVAVFEDAEVPLALKARTR